jgi:hypothetical protein
MVTNTTLRRSWWRQGKSTILWGGDTRRPSGAPSCWFAWRESGLTQAEFARREGITYSSFAAWVQAERRVAEGGSRAAKPAIRPPQRVNFTEVRLPATAGSAPSLGLEVRLPDGTVLRGGSGAELAKLVRALRA